MLNLYLETTNMKIVFTYHFLGGQVGYILVDQESYLHIKSNYPNYGEILMDPEINPFGARPTLIEVDLYDEGTDLIEEESSAGSIEYFMGFKTNKIIGTFLEHIEKI